MATPRPFHVPQTCPEHPLVLGQQLQFWETKGQIHLVLVLESSHVWPRDLEPRMIRWCVDAVLHTSRWFVGDISSWCFFSSQGCQGSCLQQQISQAPCLLPKPHVFPPLGAPKKKIGPQTLVDRSSFPVHWARRLLRPQGWNYQGDNVCGKQRLPWTFIPMGSCGYVPKNWNHTHIVDEHPFMDRWFPNGFLRRKKKPLCCLPMATAVGITDVRLPWHYPSGNG